MFGLAIRESILFSLTLGAATFITMAYTHLPLTQVPLLPILTGAGILYAARLMIHQGIHNENKVRYRRMRGDDHIKVFKGPPKMPIWKKIVLLSIVIVVLFFLYQCVHQYGLEDFELPIKLSRL